MKYRGYQRQFVVSEKVKWTYIGFTVSGVELLQRLELLDQGLVLVLQDSHPVLQTLDVLLLLPAALPGGLSVLHQANLAFPVRLLLLKGLVIFSHTKTLWVGDPFRPKRQSQKFFSKVHFSISYAKLERYGGSIAQWLAYSLPDPAALDLIPSIPEIFSEEKVANVAV